METTEYTQSAGIFHYDGLSCLRNAYAHNSCSACLDICAFEAFSIQRKKLKLDPALCTACGGCVGVCPTNSLYLLADTLEKYAKKLLDEQEAELTCTGGNSCLARFSSQDLISLSLQTQKSFTCNLSLCENCEINKENKLLEFIQTSIGEANLLLSSMGENQIDTTYENKEAKVSRRAFFKSLVNPTTQEKFVHRSDTFKTLLKENLKEDVFIDEKVSFIHFKKIEDSCTNCGECIEFCPTKALSFSSDKTKILFQNGKCIGCGICEDICKSDSIKETQKRVNLVEFAYNKAEVLITHDIRICKLCKCAFSYKEGEVLCQRCKTFELEHKGIFTLACEM